MSTCEPRKKRKIIHERDLFFSSEISGHIPRRYSNNPMLRNVLKVAEQIAVSARERSVGATRTKQNSFAAHNGTQNHGDVLEFSESEMKELTNTIKSVTTKTLDLREGSFRRSKEIVYMDVHQDEDVCIAVFVIPKGKSIPLHDHPFMTVFSKVLWGELEISSYDLVGDPFADIGRGRIAIEHPVCVAKANDMRVLTPRSHNIHQFRAKSSTAVFDVMIPPYDSESGRSCHYFTPLEMDKIQMSQSPESGELEGLKKVFLKQVECPEDYSTGYQEYTGETL